MVKENWYVLLYWTHKAIFNNVFPANSDIDMGLLKKTFHLPTKLQTKADIR